jgi:hypothetical protein
LKKYHKQDDVDMLDLKMTGQTIAEDMLEASFKQTDKKEDKEKAKEKLNARTKGKGVWKD